MQYKKPALSHDQQADLLLGRGMVGSRDEMIRCLKAVSYYRLSGYWYPFRDGNSFKAGTTFQDVWRIYAFDRQLRCLVMDAIERVEIAVRTDLAYQHAMRGGPFAYADDPTALPELFYDERQTLLDKIAQFRKDSKEAFVKHFDSKYADCHQHLPVWMAAELLSFGNVVTFFRGSGKPIRDAIASRLRVHEQVLASWLLALNTVRNVCAHHGRLWNRGIGTQPKIPKFQREWHQPVEIAGNRLFVVLTLLRYCLRHFAPQSKWHQRLRKLLDESPAIPLAHMGFPTNWDKSPIWK